MAKLTVFQELVKATGVTQADGEGQQTFAFRVCEGIADLDDNGYDALSKPAQKWYEAATEVINANMEKTDKEAIPDMPGFEESEAEPEAKPAKKKSKAAPAAEEEEEETESDDAADDDAEEETGQEEEQEQEQEKPKPTKKDAKVKATKTKAKKPANKPKVKTKAPAKTAAKKPAKTAAKKPAKEKKEGAGRSVNKDGVAYKLRVEVVKNPAITLEALCKKIGVKAEKDGSYGSYVVFRYQEAKRVMEIVNALNA